MKMNKKIRTKLTLSEMNKVKKTLLYKSIKTKTKKDKIRDEIIKNSLFYKINNLQVKREGIDLLNINIEQTMYITFSMDCVETAEIELNSYLFELFCKESSNYLNYTRRGYGYIEYMGNNFGFAHPKQHYTHIYFFAFDIMHEILQQIINIVDDQTKDLLTRFKNKCKKCENYNFTLMIPIYRPQNWICSGYELEYIKE